jgi:transglutaminase-like putative cysteine protease
VLLEIEHHLRFEYSAFIRESHMEVRVEPRSQAGQVLHDFRLNVGPNTRVTRFEDWVGNTVHWFSITDYHDRIELLVQSVVDTWAQPPLALQCEDPLPSERLELALYDYTLFGGPIIKSEPLELLQQELGLATSPTLGECMRRLGDGLAERFEYRKNVTRFDSNTNDFLESHAGVCQDYTHLGLGLLRNCGIPCRYVNGYLHVDTQDIEPSQSHAWLEFYSPSNGWTPFDPTHNRQPDDRYVIIGYGRSYNDVPPNQGIYSGTADEQLEAWVITRPVVDRDRLRLAEGATPIDLPVYRELPARDGASELSAGESAASHQQQQQQQQKQSSQPC